MPTITIGDNTGDDFSGTEDTHISESNATTNYDTTTPIEVTKYDVGNHTHALMKFSGISNLPGALTVSGATLYFYQEDNSGGAVYNITAKKLNRNWVIDEVTWNIHSTGNNWSTGGALHETNDRSSTTTFDVSSPADNNTYHSFSSAQLASDVEDFADGTLSNYGWHLERTDAGNDNEWKKFRPEEGANTTRPYLSVTYTVPAGGIVVLRRRRM